MKKFNPKYIPYIAAGIQIVMFSLAGSIYIGLKGWLFGGLLGAISSLSMTYASTRIAEVAIKRRKYAWIGFLILASFSPVFVGYAMYLDTPQITDNNFRIAIAIIWGMLPDAGTALSGFIAGKGLVAVDKQPGSRTGKSGKQAGRQKKRKSKMAEISECKYECGRTGTLGAMNSHARFCEKNPRFQFAEMAKK